MIDKSGLGQARSATIGAAGGGFGALTEGIGAWKWRFGAPPVGECSFRLIFGAVSGWFRAAAALYGGLYDRTEQGYDHMHMVYDRPMAVYDHLHGGYERMQGHYERLCRFYDHRQFSSPHKKASATSSMDDLADALS